MRLVNIVSIASIPTAPSNLRGERQGICDCPKSSIKLSKRSGGYRRHCTNCRRWVGPAYYPEWYTTAYPNHPTPQVPMSPTECKVDGKLLQSQTVNADGIPIPHLRRLFKSRAIRRSLRASSSASSKRKRAKPCAD